MGDSLTLVALKDCNDNLRDKAFYRTGRSNLQLEVYSKTRVILKKTLILKIPSICVSFLFIDAGLIIKISLKEKSIITTLKNGVMC